MADIGLRHDTCTCGGRIRRLEEGEGSGQSSSTANTAPGAGITATVEPGACRSSESDSTASCVPSSSTRSIVLVPWYTLRMMLPRRASVASLAPQADQ